MNDNPAAQDRSTVSPEDAFALIGHEIRVQILEVLANTDREDRPLTFSEIRSQLDDIDSAHFNYHLNELVGHFLKRTDEGYDFWRTGRRVTQAIRSGAVTGDQMSELTQVNQRCPYCDGRLEAIYHDERVGIYCPGCPGTYGSSNFQEEAGVIPDEYGFLGLHSLPPSGMEDRTPSEIVEAAHEWSLNELVSTAKGLCPRCASAFDEWLTVCDDHGYAGSHCQRCGNRHAVRHSASCTNCTYDQRVVLGIAFLDDTELQSFLTANGVNIASNAYEEFASVFKTYEEDIKSIEPFEGTLTFTAGENSFDLTIAEEYPVEWRPR